MQRACILSLMALLLPACGQRFAAANPLEPATAPAAVSCPSRYGFEAAGSVAGWQAPTWAPGIAPSLSRDGAHATCGDWAMKGHLNLHGSDTGVVYLLFTPQQDVSGRTVSANLYYAAPPPADLGLRIYFIDRANNWITPDGAQHYGQRQGWNQVVESFNVPGTDAVVGVLLQFSTNNGATYDGDVWIDDVSW